jgi:hypothetical protein
MKKIALILLASLFVLLSGCLLVPYYGDTVAPVPAAPTVDYGWVFAPDYGWVYWIDGGWVYYNSVWVYWPAFNINVYHYYRYHPWNTYHQYYGGPGGHPQRTFIPENEWQKSHPGYQPHQWKPDPWKQH